MVLFTKFNVTLFLNVTLSFHARRIYYDSEKEVLLLFCTCHIHLYDRADSGISVVFFTDTWYIGAFYARECMYDRSEYI